MGLSNAHLGDGIPHKPERAAFDDLPQLAWL